MSGELSSVIYVRDFGESTFDFTTASLLQRIDDTGYPIPPLMEGSQQRQCDFCHCIWISLCEKICPRELNIFHIFTLWRLLPKPAKSYIWISFLFQQSRGNVQLVNYKLLIYSKAIGQGVFLSEVFPWAPCRIEFSWDDPCKFWKTVQHFFSGPAYRQFPRSSEIWKCQKLDYRMLLSTFLVSTFQY